MEEQKKPEAGGAPKHSRNRHHRRHGYFIEPPADKSAAPAEARNDKPENKKDTQNKPQRDQQKADNTQQNDNAPKHHDGANQHKRHKNNRRGKPHHKQTPPAEQTPAAPEENKAQTPARDKSANQGQHQNHNNNKKKHQQEKKEVPFTPAPQKQTPTHSAEDYEEYKLTVDEPLSDMDADMAAQAEEVEKTEVVGIRFKSTGKVYYFDPCGKKYAKDTPAIVDTARGQEFGEVAMTNSFVRSSDIVPPLRQVLRSATKEDVEHHRQNKDKETDAFRICNEKIAAHKLDMKLIDAQYTFDNTKLLFYFTSSDRVDFRNLVKDLASVFRTRIELRQIGIRDEAKLMGGLGMCGRPLCCTLFLSDFDQVSIKMAKEQNLSLNSAKISGICGRLMCCLRYEHEAYEYEIKRTPPVDSLVRTENGDGIVTEITPLQGKIKVRLLATPEVPPKTYHRDEVTMLRKKKNDDNKDNKENK